ncbi:MAG TPA: hypothetical protein VM389_04155 [Phycisphaerae bacterium]|nr:hypothetical protein [Phycisphaerae bacterium]
MAQDSLLSRFRGWLQTPAGTCVGIVAGLALMAGAVGIFVYGPSDADTEIDRLRAGGRQVWVFCRDCGYGGQMRVGVDEGFPVVCPKCHQKRAVQGYRCRNCKRIFELPDARQFTCPHCNTLHGGG